MVNGESLFSYKARTAKTDPKPRRSSAAVNTQNTAKAKGPKPLTKAEQWLKDNPPNRQGIVDEVKSMLNPRNLTGANAIEAAIKGDGMSTTKRITTGLTGIVQGLGFAAGGESGKPAVEGVKNTGVPARIANKVKRETVVVHGSPVPGLTEIKPNLSKGAKSLGYTTPEAYAANPSTGFSYKVARDYAQESGSGVSGGLGGSVYIAKAKTKDLVWREGIKKVESPIFSSEKSFKVVKEFPMFGNEVGAFDKSLKRAGVKLPKKK